MKKSLYIVALFAFAACSAPKQDAARLVCAEADMQVFPFCENGLKVTKHETVTPVEGVEGLEVVETYFVNEGKPVTVKAYELCRTEVEAKDSVVWSLQPTSSNARLDWVLPVKEGFEKQNYLGMNNSDYGGGIPVVDLWQRDGGIAIGLFEPVLRMISMPVEWKRYDNKVTMLLRYDLPEEVELAKGDTLHCYKAFRYTHKGDYFNTLRTFSEYMQANEGVEMKPSEPEAFEPVWCAWGYGRPFKMNMVLGTLDKVAELGFTWVDIDDGYQIAEGDWNTNKYFPGGDADMRHITNEIHKRGMKALGYGAVYAAGAEFAEKHPGWRLYAEKGKPLLFIDVFSIMNLRSAWHEHIISEYGKAVHEVGFDGIHMDTYGFPKTA